MGIKENYCLDRVSFRNETYDIKTLEKRNKNESENENEMRGEQTERWTEYWAKQKK